MTSLARLAVGEEDRPCEHFIWLALNSPAGYPNISAKLPDLIKRDFTLTIQGAIARKRMNDEHHRAALVANVLPQFNAAQLNVLCKLADGVPLETDDLGSCGGVVMGGMTRLTRMGWEITSLGRVMVELHRLTHA